MEEISLSVSHYGANDNHTFYNHIHTEWGGVDAILARPQFSNLKSVSVHQAQYDSDLVDVGYPFEWFFDRLPLCHKRGILRMCETTTSGPFI